MKLKQSWSVRTTLGRVHEEVADNLVFFQQKDPTLTKDKATSQLYIEDSGISKPLRIKGNTSSKGNVESPIEEKDTAKEKALHKDIPHHVSSETKRQIALRSTNHCKSHWRNPPKLLPPSPPEYFVEFPLRPVTAQWGNMFSNK